MNPVSTCINTCGAAAVQVSSFILGKPSNMKTQSNLDFFIMLICTPRSFPFSDVKCKMATNIHHMRIYNSKKFISELMSHCCQNKKNCRLQNNITFSKLNLLFSFSLISDLFHLTFFLFYLFLLLYL